MTHYLVKLKHGQLYLSLNNGQTEILLKAGGSTSSCSVGTGDWLETPTAVEVDQQVVVKIVSLKGAYRADVAGGGVQIYMGTAPEGNKLEVTPIDSLPTEPQSPFPFPFENL